MNNKDKPKQETEVIESFEIPEIKIDIDEIRQKAHIDMKGARHKWVQRGSYLVCRSCPFEHGVWIEPDKRLIGINDDGTPRFESSRLSIKDR